MSAGDSKEANHKTEASKEDDEVLRLVKAVALGLAVGDSMGATSEFYIPWEVPHLVRGGWPAKLVGGGSFGWKAGAPTDDTDMAMCILRALAKRGGVLDADVVAQEFLKWLSTGPSDVGGLTRLTLSVLQGSSKREKVESFAGGLYAYQRNPNNLPNGSLMRNGVLAAALFLPNANVGELLDATVQAGIITHFAPLSVLTCAVHSLLIRDALLARREAIASGSSDAKLSPPTLDTIEAHLKGSWTKWRAQTKVAACQRWLKEVGKDTLDKAESQLVEELKDFAAYDPWNQDYRGRSGYCVLSLRIALWALHWSYQKDSPARPKWLRDSKFDFIFNARGFGALMLAATIGADADTYCAIAGPLLAAHHPDIPAELLKLGTTAHTLHVPSRQLVSLSIT